MSEVARSSTASKQEFLARAECWTALPAKVELRTRIKEICPAASDRIARRRLEVSLEQEEVA